MSLLCSCCSLRSVYRFVQQICITQKSPSRNFSFYSFSFINVIIIFQLKHIKVDDFNDLKRLIKLHLDGNQFSDIAENLFTTQKSLEILGKYNQMLKRESVARDSFHFIIDTDLIRCSISLAWSVYMKCPLTSIGYNVQGSHKIQFCCYFYWPIFEADFHRIANIFSIHFSDLSHNRLAHIPTNAFTHLSNLTTLDLSYNKIHKMNPGTVVPWRKLHTLNISGNDQLDLFNLRLTFYVSLIEFLHHFTDLFQMGFWYEASKISHSPNRYVDRLCQENGSFFFFRMSSLEPYELFIHLKVLAI